MVKKAAVSGGYGMGKEEGDVMEKEAVSGGQGMGKEEGK